MNRLKILHFVPLLVLLAGFIVAQSATTYFGSSPSRPAIPAVPQAGSSTTVCRPTNNGLNKACTVEISDTISFSDSLSGSTTNAMRLALGQALQTVGHLLETLGTVSTFAELSLRFEMTHNTLPFLPSGRGRQILNQIRPSRR